VTEGNNPRWALPEWLRSAAQGVVGLGESTQTGSLTPEALATLTMGSVGTGATLGARGALASGASKPSIRAYHGSPHSFEKFDTAKIGTGEGAQAYGHGLYFAEKEGTADFYKQSLALQSKNEAERMAAVYLDTYGEHALDSIKRDAMSRHAHPGTYDPAIKLLESGWKPPKGHMYEVKVNTDPAKMLDWDKPFSQQSPEVQKVLRDFHAKNQAYYDKYKDRPGPQIVNPDDYSGERIYKGIAPSDSVKATETLQQLGIPGIKYLDQGSRTQGAGTSNYVVFDPETIEILRKYGFAVPSPAVPGFNAAPRQDQPPPGFRVAKDMVY
jgi:hypothetical protein